ncbi:GRXC6 [Linum perenne]
MQGLELCSNDDVRLHLTPPPPSTTTSSSSASLSIDAVESAEDRIQRLISENPVIIFSRSSCSMCHVMKKLLATIGVNPTSLVGLHLSGHLVPKLVEVGALWV